MHAKIGSISSGTLVSSEIAGNMVYELKALIKRDDDPARAALAKAALDEYQGAVAEGDEEAAQEAADVFVNGTAPGLFDSYAPPFTSFGAHAGDGADFGIWPDIDALMEAARCGDGVLKMDAGDEWGDVPGDIDYVVEVNDHGNVSLYDARSRQEIWACV